MVKPSENDIHEQIDLCIRSLDTGSGMPGMSYEEGVRDALEWVLGQAEKPLDPDVEEA